MLNTSRSRTESTNEMTEKLKSNNNKNNKNYFRSKDNMQKFINENCPTFNEQFELLNYVKSGSIGYVYEGKKKGNYNQKYAIKFCIKKKKKMKKKIKISTKK